MRRVVVTTGFGLFFGAVLQTLSLRIPLGLDLFFIPPVILVFSLQFFKPFEIIFIALCCGAIADVLGGFPVGFNMLLMLSCALILGSSKVFTGRIHRKDLIYYVIAISFLYRTVLLLSQALFLQSKANLEIMPMFFGPIVDGLISVLLYPLLVKVLSWVKVFDQNDFFRNRIGLRS